MIILGIYGLITAFLRDKVRRRQADADAKGSSDGESQQNFVEHCFTDGGNQLCDDAQDSDNCKGEHDVDAQRPTDCENQLCDDAQGSIEALGESNGGVNDREVDGDKEDIDEEAQGNELQLCEESARMDEKTRLAREQEIMERRRNIRSKIVAFLIGIVHGVAGPGGVLGIIPAVQLQNLGLAYTYLGAFCITSIFIMGTYAALFGIFTDKLSHVAHLELQIECFSAGLCIVVGVMWLCLSLTGKLEEVFG